MVQGGHSPIVLCVYIYSTIYINIEKVRVTPGGQNKTGPEQYNPLFYAYTNGF